MAEEKSAPKKEKAPKAAAAGAEVKAPAAEKPAKAPKAAKNESAEGAAPAAPAAAPEKPFELVGGVAKQPTAEDLLKEELGANPLRQTGALLSKGAFDAFKERVNPERYGGAPLLGLNGHIVKAHGSSNRRAIKSAIHGAGEMVKADMNSQIEADVARANELLGTSVLS